MEGEYDALQLHACPNSLLRTSHEPRVRSTRTDERDRPSVHWCVHRCTSPNGHGSPMRRDVGGGDCDELRLRLPHPSPSHESGRIKTGVRWRPPRAWTDAEAVTRPSKRTTPDESKLTAILYRQERSVRSSILSVDALYSVRLFTKH